MIMSCNAWLKAQRFVIFMAAELRSEQHSPKLKPLCSRCGRRGSIWDYWETGRSICTSYMSHKNSSCTTTACLHRVFDLRTVFAFSTGSLGSHLAVPSMNRGWVCLTISRTRSRSLCELKFHLLSRDDTSRTPSDATLPQFTHSPMASSTCINLIFFASGSVLSLITVRRPHHLLGHVLLSPIMCGKLVHCLRTMTVMILIGHSSPHLAYHDSTTMLETHSCNT